MNFALTASKVETPTKQHGKFTKKPKENRLSNIFKRVIGTSKKTHEKTTGPCSEDDLSCTEELYYFGHLLEPDEDIIKNADDVRLHRLLLSNLEQCERIRKRLERYIETDGKTSNENQLASLLAIKCFDIEESVLYIRWRHERVKRIEKEEEIEKLRELLKATNDKLSELKRERETLNIKEHRLGEMPAEGYDVDEDLKCEVCLKNLTTIEKTKSEKKRYGFQTIESFTYEYPADDTMTEVLLDKKKLVDVSEYS